MNSDRTIKKGVFGGMLNKDDVLKGINLKAYYAQFFGKVLNGTTEITVCSPFREDNHPSLSINLESGLWFDHGTGESGDVFSFEQRVAGVDFASAVGRLAAFALQHAPGGRVAHPSSQGRITSKSVVSGWSEALFSAAGSRAKKYLNGRGLSDETLREYLVGYDLKRQAVTLPLKFNEEGATSLKVFFFDSEGWKIAAGKKVIRSEGETVLYCAERISEEEVVILCEGELDCLLLRQYGACAVSGTGGAGTFKDEWVAALKGKHVTIIYDSDESGRKGVLRVAKKLKGIVASYNKVDLFRNNDGSDKNRKDVTDFIKGGGDIKSLLIEIKGAAHNAVPAPERGARNGDKKPPLVIAEEVIEANDLISVGDSFFLYGDGVWSPDRRRRVERKIMERAANQSSRGLIESVKYLISLQCQIENEQLNATKRLVNFQNGMLDLESCELLPHSKGYHSTVQLPFDYYANAVSPRWEQFLREVFSGDEELALLLQEIYGYVLVPDTFMQKMFWFVGEGANGKGVAIRVLEALIDKSNRTSLSIRDLQSPFVRAALHNKLLAIQGDFPRKFFGNEDLVKAIVGGDTIDAQQKFGPQFEFAPFCRFLFAMNRLPDTKDVSAGFFRRVEIVPFNRVFVDSEQDRSLVAKLRGELPGIFVWALKGLKRLQQNQAFTESSEAQRAVEEYHQSHGTVERFLKEEVVVGDDQKVKASDLWEAYDAFCNDLGITRLERREFVAQLKKKVKSEQRTHRWGDDGKPARTYTGIGLREGTKE